MWDIFHFSDWNFYIFLSKPDLKFNSRYITLHKFEVWGPWKVPQMWHSPFKPNLYVDYGNMIHFAVSAWTLEMSLNTDSPFCPIWWWILPTFNRPSEVQAFSAKWIIFPYSTYKLGLNGLCHIRGTFYWPQTSNLWSVLDDHVFCRLWKTAAPFILVSCRPLETRILKSW